MPGTSPNSLSQKRANVLLAAWYSGDLLRLEAALRQSYTTKGSRDAADTAQSEREEMLAAIECTIRGWLSNPATDAEDLRVSLHLLRHLAGCEFSPDAAPLHVPSGFTRSA